MLFFVKCVPIAIEKIYSVRNDFTGFATPAFTAWKPIVTIRNE